MSKSLWSQRANRAIGARRVRRAVRRCISDLVAIRSRDWNIGPSADDPRAPAAVEALEPRTMLAADVTISEFMASNISGLRDQFNQVADWIELRNSSASAVNLKGWHLTDNAADLNKWTFPDVSIAGNGYMIVFADNKDLRDPSAPLHTNFHLDAGGEYLALVEPDGTSKATEFAPQYPKQQEDISYGFDGSTLRYFATPTPGWANARSEVVINEIHYDPDVKTELVEFVELYNPGSAAVDLSGAAFSSGVDYTFPAGTTLAGKGYLVVAENPTAFAAKFGKTALGPWVGNLSNSGETLTLRNASGGKLDEVSYGAGFPWPTVGDGYNNVSGTGPSIELINPDFDNNLGGNWRRSLAPSAAVDTVLIPQRSNWDYRKGTSDYSPDMTVWQKLSFVEDSSWTANQPAPIGYNNYGPSLMGTTLSDMKGSYISIFLRKTFTVADPSKIGSLRIDAFYDDGFDMWINGTRVTHSNVSGSGNLAYNIAAGNPPGQGARGTYTSASYDPLSMVDATNPASYLVAGTNVITVELRNINLGSSGDCFFDADLIASPPGSSITYSPTPGSANSVYSTNAPPDVRQVNVNGGGDSIVVPPLMPVTITAKITDADGVGSVNLSYRAIDPGSYVPLGDAGYDSGWTSVSMRDDGLNGDAIAGDGVYSAVLPSSVQINRRLVRYRITATDTQGNSIRAPYTDDAVPNFAYYVYAGVPGWSGQATPSSPVVNYSASLMNSLPVYQVIARNSDITAGILGGAGYGGEDYPWHGTFVYDGKVYDDVGFRARGGVWRYAMGKNMWKISFARNHEVQIRDNYGNPYPTKWSKLDLGACIQQGDYGHRGEQGLFESVNFKLYQLAGVPAPDTNFAELRVVDNASETGATQFDSDLWGLYLAVQPEDGNFLDDNGLPDGNLYKMDGGDTDPKDPVYNAGSYVNQGPTQPTNFSDLDAFIGGYSNSTQTEQWFQDNVDLSTYYSYRAISEGIHHGDTGYGKNYFYYHNPVTNKWTLLPWDTDLTWAESMYGNGNDPLKATILYSDRLYTAPHPGMTTEYIAYQNRLREIIDLLYNPEQTGQLIDEMAAKIYTAGQPSFVDVDRAMWDYNPIMVSGYVNPSKSGQGRFYSAAVNPPGGFAGMIQMMKNYINYALTSTRNWMGDPGNGPSMNSLAADSAIPNKPSVTVVGKAPPVTRIPVDAMKFRSSLFSSPVGSQFAAMKWRIAEITDPNAPGYDPKAPKHYEIQSSWESPEITTFNSDITIPGSAVEVGHTYRVRVRFKDSTGRWSNWSAPVQFVADPASSLVKDALRITELNYNPAPPPPASPYTRDDFEFVELKNTGAATINVQGAAFTNGINYAFADPLYLAPGQSVVVARNVDAFKSRYPSYGVTVVGGYTGKFDDNGERVELDDALGQMILDFRYEASWYPSTAGAGRTLVVVNPLAPNVTWSTAGNWRESRCDGGTPGADESAVANGSIVVNEVLSHTDAPSGDWIELYNTTDADIPIGGWWLSDSPADPQRYQIDPSAVVPAHGFVYFTANSTFNTAAARVPFALDEQGEQVVLSSANLAGALSGFDEKQSFGPAEKEVTFGRYISSTGPQFVAMSAPTMGDANSPPKVGPIVINEIMYAPAAGKDEYIELRNISNSAVPLYDPAHPENTWQFTGDVQYGFPTGSNIDAGQFALVVGIDPAIFRSKYNIPAAAQIFGPYVGLLDDSADTVALCKPGDVEPPLPLAYIVEDRIDYASVPPWTGDTSGTGKSLSRINSAAFGNDPVNWTAEDGGSPGLNNFDWTPPAATITAPDPSAGAVEAITITFSEPVVGFDLADVSLTRNGGANLLPSSGVALSSADGGKTWVLGGLRGLTFVAGSYSLKLAAAGSGVADLAGNALLADAAAGFVVDKTALAGTDTTDSYVLSVDATNLVIVETLSRMVPRTFTVPLDQISSLTIDGRGGDDSLTINSALPFTPVFLGGAGANALKINAGSYSLTGDLGAGGADVSVAIANATAEFTASQHLSSLNIAQGGRVNLAADGARFIRTAGLGITGNGTLDLFDNDLIVQSDSGNRTALLDAISTAIASARGTSGAWAGSGITSTTAAANVKTGLAVVLNEKLDQEGQPSTIRDSLAGETVDRNCILVKYTWNGDTNLDGIVNFDDYYQINTGFLSNGAMGGYRNGDLNFDKLVNFDDYYLINTAFLGQGGTVLSAPAMGASVSPGRASLAQEYGRGSTRMNADQDCGDRRSRRAKTGIGNKRTVKVRHHDGG